MSEIRRKRILFALGFVCIGGLTTSTFWLLFTAHDKSLTGTVIQAVSAVLVPATGLGMWLLRKRFSGRPIDVDAAADKLAAAAKEHWERAATERRLRFPGRIPVQWSWTTEDVAGPRSDALGTFLASPRMAPLPGIRPVGPWDVDEGGLSDLMGIFGGIDSGRIVLLGSAGAGKSSAAILLLLDVLEHRFGLVEAAQRRRTPVPVILTLGDWDAAHQPLRKWASARLELEYPFLLAPEFGRGTAERLISTGRVALLLDGLDDLPQPLRPAALRALDEQSGGIRIVLLSRSRELLDAVTVGGHFAGVAALELQPVTPGQAATYLERCCVDPPPPGWRKLIEHLRQRTGDALTHALDNPLMLSLVRETYQPSDNMTDLFPQGGFENREKIEDHLLQRVLTVAYSARPGEDAPRYTVDQATQWLSHIAAQMTKQRTRDLAWWLIQRWRPRWFRIAVTILILMLSLGVGLGILVAGSLSVKTLSYGVVFAVTLGLIYGPGGGQPRHWTKVRWREIISHDKIIVVARFSIALGFMAFTMFSWWYGYAYGVTTGLLSAATAGVVSWFFYSVACPSVDSRSPLLPLVCWRREYRYRTVFGLVLGFAFGIVTGLATVLILPDQFSIFDATVGSMEGAIPYGLAFGVVSSKNWAAGLSFCQLRIASKGPLRMIRFLEDASKRGVMRTVGPLYQFRHARLQDRLAEVETARSS
jgi:hypothetical protein